MTMLGRTPLWPAGHLPLKGGDQLVAKIDAGVISPLEGEMAGRPEGGAKERLLWIGSLAAILILLPAPAFANLDPVAHGSFIAGVSHPLFGLDHILAMVAVGLWAALLGGRAVWLVPTAFVGTMMAGFGVALAGLGLPFVEPVIAASVLVLGLLALVALQVPTALGMVTVGFFALFHGHAHGGELGEAGALSFCLGFALSTAVLHGLGVGIGLGLGRIAGGTDGRWITRMAGGLTALGGLYILAGS